MKVLVVFDLTYPAPPDGRFSLRALAEEEDKATEADVIRCLRRMGHEVETLAVFDDVTAVIEKIRAFTPYVVFNLTESVHGERAHEPNLPALFELLKVRYTGSGPQALFLCKDKSLAKKLLAYHRVRVARFVTSHRSRPLRRLRGFVYPAFVKPAQEEGSEGISLASFASNEQEALERARFIHEKFRSDALIEEYIDGRELYLGVLGNQRLTVLPPRELFFDHVPDDAPKFATFKAKWDDAYRERWGIRNAAAAPLPEGVPEKLRRLSRKVYRLLKIRGFGRLDLRLTPEGEIVVMEANPNPSLAENEDLAQAAWAAGIYYDDLIQRILDAASTGDA